MKSVSVVVSLAAFAAILIGAPPGFAQQSSPEARPVTEEVRVNVVNVDVFVTGRHDTPVLDLRPDEFELREDGRVVALTNFLGPAAAPAASVAGPGAPAGSGAAPLSEEEPQHTFVVLVDRLNLSVLTRHLVLARLEGFVAERMRRGDRVLVLGFDRSLRHETPLTDDAVLVASALRKVQREVGEDEISRGRRDHLAADSGGPGPGGRPFGRSPGTPTGADPAMAPEERDYLERSLRVALGRVFDSLSGMPGRKTLLYVGEGLPDVGASSWLRGELREIEAVRTRADTRDLTRRANAGLVTVFAINVGGATGLQNYSLEMLTGGTGGQRLFNPDMLERMEARLETAYSLGYAPAHFGDGAYHRLSVRVHRAGVRARCREGYLDKTVEQRQADRTTAALLSGGNANPLRARVGLGVAVPQGEAAAMVPLTVRIPATSLVLLPRGAGYEGAVSLTIVVAGSDGTPSYAHREVFPVRVPAGDVAGFLEQDTSFTFSLLVRPGDTSLSITARDEIAQTESVVVTKFVASPGKA